MLQVMIVDFEIIQRNKGFLQFWESQTSLNQFKPVDIVMLTPPYFWENSVKLL